MTQVVSRVNEDPNMERGGRGCNECCFLEVKKGLRPELREYVRALILRQTETLTKDWEGALPAQSGVFPVSSIAIIWHYGAGTDRSWTEGNTMNEIRRNGIT